MGKGCRPVTKCPEPPPPTEEENEEGVEEGAKDESQAGQKLQQNGCHLAYEHMRMEHIWIGYIWIYGYGYEHMSI